jgi:outer membrane protein OmpA-like peptidoglycan-associated protein
MKFSNLLSVPIVALALSACTNLDALNRQGSLSADPFDNALTEEYRNFANAEQAQFDWYDSDYFARKGLAANSGIKPLPEDIRHWNIPAERQEEMLWNYDRLMKMLMNDSVRNKHPRHLSKAQLLFDCWVEQEEERWQKEDIKDCRTQFLKELAIVENRLSIPPKGTGVSRAKTQPEAEQVHKKHTVHFGFDKHNITPGAQEKINKAISDIKELKGEYRVDVGGHTDTAGPKDYNQTLSVKRAKAVKDALVNGDVREDTIRSQGFGENILAVPTNDNVPNKQNRRVEINVHGQK